MKGISGKVFGIMVLAWVIELLVLGIFSATPAQAGVLPEFHNTWFVNRLAVRFLEFFPVATITALLFSWSFMIERSVLKKSMGKIVAFWQVVKSSIVMVISITLMYGLAMAFLYGSWVDSAEKAESDSYLAQLYKEEAVKKYSAGAFSDAYHEINKSLALDSGWGEAVKSRDMILVALQKEIELKKAAEKAPEPQRLNYTFSNLLKSIEEAKSAEDWFTALSYAELALNTASADEVPIARKIIEDIRRSIQTIELEPEERKAKDIYRIKRDAILEEYRRGNFIASYYGLKELEKKNPTDPDLREWMPKVIVALNNAVFFEDEIQEAFIRTSAHPVLVRLRSSNGQGTIFLYAGRVLRGRFAYFVSDLELYERDAGGKLVLHVKSPYAKLQAVSKEGTEAVPVKMNALTKAIVRTENRIISEAGILFGNRSEAEKNFYPLAIGAEDLWTLARVGSDYRNAGFNDLVSFLDLHSRASFDVRPVQLELLNRFSQVLGMTSLCFVAIAIGWANRSRYLHRPLVLGLLMSFFLPLAVIAFMKAWALTMQHINSGLLVLLGFNAALGVVVGLFSVLLLVSMVFAAGQQVD